MSPFNPESFAQAPAEVPAIERPHTSKRLMLALETAVKLSIKEVSVSGKESLALIPPGKRVIIVTSHISDMDVPIVASVLGPDFDLTIANESTHHSFFQHPGPNIGMKLAGKDNFIGVDFKPQPGTKPNQGQFNPENFEPMSEALERGKTVIIAGHSPTNKMELQKGGYGAVYLAGMTEGVVLLPVAVNLYGKEDMTNEELHTVKKEKPSARVEIGQPIELNKIPGIEELGLLMEKRKGGVILDKTERERFSKLTDSLREHSQFVTARIAEMVPNEKRGSYKE
jgi:hypothetical protein